MITVLQIITAIIIIMVRMRMTRTVTMITIVMIMMDDYNNISTHNTVTHGDDDENRCGNIH